MAQWERICLPMQETWILSLGRDDPLEEEMATYSSILAWESPWTEEPGGVQSIVLQKLGHDWTSKHTHIRNGSLSLLSLSVFCFFKESWSQADT